MKVPITVFLFALSVLLILGIALKDPTRVQVNNGITMQESVKTENDREYRNQDDGSTNIFTDPRDGKKYKTVKIGNQVWMAENLNYSSGFCYQKAETNCDRYGRLYTWRDALKAPPEGWHLPSREEWDTLISKLAGKGENPYDQIMPGGSSGFNVLFGGSLNGDYGYRGLDSDAAFWSSSGTTGFAFGCKVCRDDRKVKLTQSRQRSQDYYNPFCFSVRCIKD